jgi:hypothetical protein
MLRRSLVVLLLLVLPGICLGQGTSERYLSSGTQFYLRWDGFATHRAAYDKTATGQMLKGETGTFLNKLWTYLNEQIAPLLNQVDPDVAQVIKEVPPALKSICENGFAMAVEMRKINPPEVEATFVFPRSGGAKAPLANLVKQILEITRAETKELRIDDANLQHFHMEPLHWAFGSEGDTAIMVVGTVDPANVIRRGSEKGNNITKNPLYKELQKFKEFQTWSSGYIDLAAILKPVGELAPEAGRLIDDVGLNGLKSITFHSGFDGLASRSVMDANMPGPRKGLLMLTKGRKFSMDELPSLPADVTSFSAGSMDAPVMYDTFTQVAEGGIRVFSPDIADGFKEGIKGVEALVGVKIRDDLLGSLGDMVVRYNSPADGFLGLGAVTMVQVKDPKKLISSLEAVHKAFPGIPGLEFDLQKRNYRGVDVAEFHLGASITTPTFALHDGWLIYANYPQPIHGYIMRIKGDLPTWKAEPRVAKTLAAFPKEFVAISYSDPRPGVQFMFSLVPPVMSAVNGVARQFIPGAKSFEVGSIPHPLEATRHLFPNISVSTDDGQKLRVDTRSSLVFPF